MGIARMQFILLAQRILEYYKIISQL